MNKHLFLALVAPFALFGQMRSNQSQQPPSIESMDNFDLSAEFLFWTADVDGTDLVVRESFSGPSTALIVNKEIIDLDGKWEPGCRIAGGYHFGFFDQWDFLGAWTYYHGRSENESRSVPTDLSGDFLRQGWSPFLGPIVTSAIGHWSLNLNLADLELGRTYEITSQVSMRPHAGVRGGFVDLNYLASYTGAWTTLSADGATATILSQGTNFKADSDFRGGGLVAGSGLRWSFNDTWAFWGDLTASLLYGRFSVQERFQGADFGDQVNTSENSIALVSLTERYKDHFSRVRGTLDLLFGLEARTKFNKDRSRMTFFVGYELLKLFRFNELFLVNRALDSRILGFTEDEIVTIGTTADAAQFELIPLSNDIGFQGITAKVEFEF